MSRYAATIDLTNPNMNHTQVVRLTGESKRVLDIGCWTGDLGAVLKDQGCTVTGIEYVAEAAAEAEKRLDRVVVADLNVTTSLPDVVGDDKFDVVVFSEVLEHLLHPSDVLRSAADVLAEGGRVVVSVPNVTHGSLRLSLLQGAWNMAEQGLLDRTHINFYSRLGLIRLIEEAGFVVEELRGTLADPMAVDVPVDDSALPEHVIEWVRDQDDAYVYQFQLIARPRAHGDIATSSIELVPAVPLSSVRASDHHTDALVKNRRDSLMMRDHIIGLQAEATSATLKAERATARANKLRDRVSVLRAQARRRERVIDNLQQDIRKLEHQLVVANAGWAGIARSAARRLRRS